MKFSAIACVLLTIVSLSLAGCDLPAKGEAPGESHAESGHHEHKIVVTSPIRKNVISTQKYVCQIHSCQHIEVRALEGGYLDKIHVKEGQAVKKGDPLFEILPTIYQAKLDSEDAEAQRIQIEFNNAKTLSEKAIVSPQQLALKQAELAKAQGRVKLAGQN